MKKHDFDFLVFIGRFQPFHNGHLRVVQEALRRSSHVIILCGSAHQPRSLRNPFSFKERARMIQDALPGQDQQRVLTAPLMDVLYNDEAWIRSVQTTVEGLVAAYYRQVHTPPRIGLVGRSKDHTSYYLNLFPQWSSVDVSGVDMLNATDLRNELFAGNNVDDRVPQSTAGLLAEFVEEPAFDELVSEAQFIRSYRSGWDAAPYPPTFVTVDAVVVQSGHVLMVERSARPGKGLWALPGGFVDGNETVIDACLRELKEETKIKLPLPVLKGAIRESRVFDDPHRSSRGRTITHAFHLALPPDARLPRIKGSSDARRAFWLPLAELDPARCFEDHYFIVQNLLGG